MIRVCRDFYGLENFLKKNCLRFYFFLTLWLCGVFRAFSVVFLFSFFVSTFFSRKLRRSFHALLLKLCLFRLLCVCSFFCFSFITNGFFIVSTTPFHFASGGDFTVRLEPALQRHLVLSRCGKQRKTLGKPFRYKKTSEKETLLYDCLLCTVYSNILLSQKEKNHSLFDGLMTN